MKGIPIKKTNYNAPAVGKAAELIELLSRAPRPMGLSEIVRALNSNKNMCMRILVTLESQGWLAVDEGPKYKLSLGLFQIASRPLTRLDVVNEAFPPLQELWLDLGVNVYMGIPYKDQMLRVVNFESTGRTRISSPVGTLTGLCEGSGGMALLAYYPKDRIEKIMTRIQKNPESCCFCPIDKVPAGLKKIRKSELAVHDNGGSFRCVASPVFDYTGQVVAAVSSTLLCDEYSLAAVKEKIEKRLLETARTISKRMGHST